MPNVGSIKILLLPSKVKGFLRGVYKYIQIQHVHHRNIFFFFIRENGQKCKNNIISSQTELSLLSDLWSDCHVSSLQGSY